MSIVTEYVRNLIAKQVDDNGLVIWYDPDGAYADAVEALDLPTPPSSGMRGASFVSAGKSI